MDLSDLFREYETFRNAGIDLPIQNTKVTLKLGEKFVTTDVEQKDFEITGEKEVNLQPLTGDTESSSIS